MGEPPPQSGVSSKVLRVEENGVFFLDTLGLLIPGNTAVHASDDVPNLTDGVSEQAATTTAGQNAGVSRVGVL